MFFLFVVAACDALYGRPRIKEAIVKDTVRKYLNALADAYRYMELSGVKKYTGGKERDKIVALVGLLGMKHQIMESRILDVKFTGIKFDTPEKARVNTIERWRFRYLHMASGKEVKPWKEVMYYMSYVLSKEGGMWKVISSTMLQQNEIKNEGVKPHGR